MRSLDGLLYVCMLVYLSACFYQSDNVNSECLHLIFYMSLLKEDDKQIKLRSGGYKIDEYTKINRQMDQQTNQQTDKWTVRQALKDRSKE